MYVYVVMYFNDIHWCIDGIYKDEMDAETRVQMNKMSGIDSYVDSFELE